MRQLSEQLLASQKVKVTTELRKIRQRCDDFYDYLEPDMMTQYAGDVRSVQKRLSDLIDQIQWIHREESLYKQPLTEYPEVEDIGSSLELFYRLFYVIGRWQKAEKKYVCSECALSKRASTCATKTGRDYVVRTVQCHWWHLARWRCQTPVD